MAKKSGLGRGLDALITSTQGEPAVRGVQQIPLEAIQPNPRQPRARVDEQQLAELAASIREHGVIQPLIVTEIGGGQGYTLIAGERRLLAARQAGLREVPVILREASEQQLVELALVENVQRADLNPLEAAEAYRQLNEDFGLSHEEIAERVGKSRVAVTNTMRLLKLVPIVQQALVEGSISEGHARALLTLPTPQAQSAALQIVLQKGLNVRQTEEYVRRLSGERPSPKPAPSPAPEIKALEERLREYFGTKVSLKQRGIGGSLVINYYSQEELEAILGLIFTEETPDGL